MKTCLRLTLFTYLLAAGAGSTARAQVQNVPANVSYTFTSEVSTCSGTITYQRYRNGAPIAGATSRSYALPASEATGTAVEFKCGTMSSS